PAHPRVGRRGVQIEPVLLGVLAVVALGAGQAEDALLQHGVAAVPEGQRKAEGLAVVADPCEAVLAPAVDARASLVVRKEVPGGTPRAVVLSDGAPCPLTQVRAPATPGRPASGDLQQALTLCAHTELVCARAVVGSHSPALGSLTHQLRDRPRVELS